MVLELERADRVCDAFDRIRQGMREIVHWIHAPGITGAVMRRMPDAIERRVAHVDVRRRHVDFCPQDVCAIGELTRAHAPKQLEVLGHGPVAVGAVPAWFGQRAAVLANLVGAQAVDIRLALANQLFGVLIQHLEVVRGVMQLRPLETEPANVFLDRFDVLDVFLRGIGVIEAEVAQPAEFRRDAEVQADRLRVADVQIAVWFGRKPGVHTAAVPSAPLIVRHDFAHEIERCRRRRCPGVKLHPGNYMFCALRNPSRSQVMPRLASGSSDVSLVII